MDIRIYMSDMTEDCKEEILALIREEIIEGIDVDDMENIDLDEYVEEKLNKLSSVEIDMDC